MRNQVDKKIEELIPYVDEEFITFPLAEEGDYSMQLKFWKIYKSIELFEEVLDNLECDDNIEMTIDMKNLDIPSPENILKSLFNSMHGEVTYLSPEQWTKPDIMVNYTLTFIKDDLYSYDIERLLDVALQLTKQKKKDEEPCPVPERYKVAWHLPEPLQMKNEKEPEQREELWKTQEDPILCANCIHSHFVGKAEWLVSDIWHIFPQYKVGCMKFEDWDKLLCKSEKFKYYEPKR